MIFRSETHVFGQSSLFESMLCDSRFSRRERESRTRRRAAKSTREVSAHLSTDRAAARQRGSEREQNKTSTRKKEIQLSWWLVGNFFKCNSQVDPWKAAFNTTGTLKIDLAVFVAIGRAAKCESLVLSDVKTVALIY